MSLQVENLEHNMAKVTIEVEAAKLDDAIKQAFNKKKGQFNVPGFRKGKVPFQLIAKEYGVEIFYEDAANILIPDAYAEAMKDTDLEIVSRPEIDVTQLEKGKDFIFTATFALKPEVTLGDYKGIEVPKTRVTVKKDEIEEELKKNREKSLEEGENLAKKEMAYELYHEEGFTIERIAKLVKMDQKIVEEWLLQK